jgi:hypothetical protein
LSCEVKIQVEEVQFSFKIQLENDFPKSRPIFHSSALDLTENATVTLEDLKVEKEAEAMELAKHIFDDTIPHLVKALFLKLGYNVQPPTKERLINPSELSNPFFSIYSTSDEGMGST